MQLFCLSSKRTISVLKQFANRFRTICTVYGFVALSWFLLIHYKNQISVTPFFLIFQTAFCHIAQIPFSAGKFFICQMRFDDFGVLLNQYQRFRILFQKGVSLLRAWRRSIGIASFWRALRNVKWMLRSWRAISKLSVRFVDDFQPRFIWSLPMARQTGERTRFLPRRALPDRVIGYAKPMRSACSITISGVGHIYADFDDGGGDRWRSGRVCGKLSHAPRLFGGFHAPVYRRCWSSCAVCRSRFR